MCKALVDLFTASPGPGAWHTFIMWMNNSLLDAVKAVLILLLRMWTLLSTVLCLKHFFFFWFWVLTLFSYFLGPPSLGVLCRLPLMLLFHSFYLVPVFLHPIRPFSRGSHQPPWIRLPSVAQILRPPALICFLHFRVPHSPACWNVSHYQHTKKWTLFSPSKLSNHLCFSSHQIEPLFKPGTRV